MNDFKLHPQLQNDCHMLGKLDFCQLLLMDNALLPWFILVPETDITEFHKLPFQQQQLLVKEINLVSDFIEHHFTITKINTATIGNIVRQLHIHVIGRHETDFCWPGVAWGRPEKQLYEQSTLDTISQAWHHWLTRAK